MKETKRAKQAWADYVAMGDDRSLIGLVRYYQQQAEKGVQVPCLRYDRMRVWSFTFKWRERIERIALEAQASAESDERERLTKRRVDLSERVLETCERLLDKANEMLKFPVARIERVDNKTTIHPAKWTFDTPARIADTATKLYALAEQMRDGKQQASVKELIEHMASEMDLTDDAKHEALVYAEGYIKALNEKTNPFAADDDQK